ncbi:MAG TPA: diguanylate cyclase [Gaiellaceae bacterium]|nr:diguanylate cyclase [Gaiellaceae bacterium]
MSGRLAVPGIRIRPDGANAVKGAAVNPPAAIPRKVLMVVTPVIAAGVFAVGWAAYRYAVQAHSWAHFGAVVSLFVAIAVAERFPVPVEGMGAGGVTLGFVFSLASLFLVGWPAAVVIVSLGPGIAQLIGGRPLVRVSYNSSMFALSALAAGVVIDHLHGGSVGILVARVVVGALVYYWVVTLVLISSVLSADSGRAFHKVIWENAVQTTPPFALMSSAALILVVLWQRAPALSVALVGPLLAIALYQRSTHKALQAMRLALTDPLTGLGNHRSFHERLQRELDGAEHKGTSVALCLVDLDDLKSINDRHGHPVGDKVLGHIASRLRQGGEAFRLGGDEFAVLLPEHDERAATAVARSIVERIAAVQIDGVGPVTVSAGVATFPMQGIGRDELIRLADSALYWAKEDGKNRVRAYAAESILRANLEQLADSPDRAARYRAAESLAQAVDARDVYTGRHSQRVGDYAAKIARRLGADEPTVELTRLAGSLHDLGKLAIPEELLRKPTALSDGERLVLERHPQIGFRMLESLGVEPVAEWVLHHHERWDGTGYPNGLAGEQIPLGARIIFVADAFDAMTSDQDPTRAHRDPRTEEEALAELERCAGTQFDPAVVDAFAAELRADREAAVPA